MSILDLIVADTRELIVKRKQLQSLSSLRERADYEMPRRDFERSLRECDVAIIAELKRRSPSKGEIRSDFDVGSLAASYSAAGAAAISVLTEPFHFGGDLAFLAKARLSSRSPILRKDFIIDPYQIVEARAYGADAVLLIATILSASQLSELQETCREEGLAALVEVYEPEELERIDIDRTPIIGANNRDLNSFDVDLDRSLAVLSKLPDATIKVAESGLTSVSDLEYLIAGGIDAFLIGERFMIDEDPGRTLRNWLVELRKKTFTDGD